MHKDDQENGKNAVEKAGAGAEKDLQKQKDKEDQHRPEGQRDDGNDRK